MQFPSFIAFHAGLLLTPHNGSRTSPSPEFIAAVAPAIVVHSAGWHHRFHHPRPEVVERYRVEGAQQFNTATSGAVTVSVDSNGLLDVSEYRRAATRLWSVDEN